MPCKDDGYRDGFRDEGTLVSDDELIKYKKIEAILCGVLTYLSKQSSLQRTMNGIDWTEVGVTRKQAESWWKSHKKADEERRQREQAAKDLAKKVRQLKKKLSETFSDEEIELLRNSR